MDYLPSFYPTTLLLLCTYRGGLSGRTVDRQRTEGCEGDGSLEISTADEPPIIHEDDQVSSQSKMGKTEGRIVSTRLRGDLV